MDESIALNFNNLDMLFRSPYPLRRSREYSIFRFLITPSLAKLIAEDLSLLELTVRCNWYSLKQDEQDIIKKFVLQLSTLGVQQKDRSITEFAVRVILSWSSLLCLTNFFAVYKANIQSIVKTVTEHIDRENREYLATIPSGEQWLDGNSEAKALVELGLQQAATETSVYLGSFAQYASLEIDD